MVADRQDKPALAEARPGLIPQATGAMASSRLSGKSEAGGEAKGEPDSGGHDGLDGLELVPAQAVGVQSEGGASHGQEEPGGRFGETKGQEGGVQGLEAPERARHVIWVPNEGGVPLELDCNFGFDR